MKANRKTGISGLGIEILGWILVLAGIAGLILPGPGLLGLFAGLALLATRYEWAERRLEPVREAAFRGARQSVADTPTLVGSIIGVLILVAFGVVWGLHPAVPGWWPLSDRLWLPGGWATGGTLIGSAVIAAAMLVYSYKNFRD